MIEVQGLTRYYGEHRAIEDISFRVADNEIVGFLGLNGAGKSTTLRILAGTLLPSAGTVRIDGVDLFSAPVEARRQTGFLPEQAPLHREMTARAYLRFLGLLRGVPEERVDAKIEEVARRTHIEDVLDRVIGTLSYGYQKRVGIAQAIVHDPRLVILDEPITGLDPVQIVEMRSVIRGLGESCTVLVSSHILSEISQTCDRILLLHEGRLVAEGSEEELARRIEPSTRIALTVRGDRSGLESLLRRRAEVASFELEDEAPGLLRARIELTGDHREALVAALVQEGFGLRRLEEAEPELEQIFVALTRDGQREEAA